MVFECLKCGLDLIGWPFLLPLVIAETKADDIRQVLQRCQTYINEFEPSTGAYVDEPCVNRREMEPTSFDKHIGVFTWTAGALACCQWTTQVYQDILEFIEAAAKSDVRVVDSPREDRDIQPKLSTLKKFMKENKWRISYLQERRESYIPTVNTAMISGPATTDNTQVYSLIAQKDNAENIRLADASVQIAKAGLQGNVDMKAIATDSKMVALATLQDSAAIRTISTITTFFLPATFTAVSSIQDLQRLSLTTMISE
jgi:hypothetical protein